jgi:hypothetical protein
VRARLPEDGDDQQDRQCDLDRDAPGALHASR